MTYSPLIFCPGCRRYVGSAPHCACGWHRPQPLPEPGAHLWARDLDAPCRGRPLLHEGTLFIGDKAGRLHALDAATGEARWPAVQVGGAIRKPPVVSGPYVVVATHTGTVMAYDVVTGQAAWPAPVVLSRQGAGAVTVHEGHIYVGDAEGRLHALLLQTGEKSGRFQTGKYIGAAPVVAGRAVLAGSHDGCLYAVDPRRMGELWSRDLGDRIATAPVVVGEFAFAGTLAGQVHKVALSGKAVGQPWRLDLGHGVTADLAASRDERTLYVGTRDGGLYAVDRESASVRWHRPDLGGVAGPPALWEGICFVGGSSGEVHALDAEDGTTLWTYEMGSPVRGVAFGGGLLYALTKDGNLTALPWHLGRWDTWSDYFITTGQRHEAAVFAVLAENVVEARRHFHYLGDFATAARLLKATGELTEAAEDYRRAADRARRRGEAAAAAVYYEEAADLFAELRNEYAANDCHLQVVRCRHAPLVQAQPLNHPDLVAGEAATLQFELTNTGLSKARRVRAKLSGECDCTSTFSVPELTAGHSLPATFERFTPRHPGKNQLFRLILGYESTSGRVYNFQVPLRLSVRAPEHPPIHVDEVIIVQGPMTRVEGSVGIVKQTGSGLVDVKGEAGAVKQEGGNAHASVGGDAGMVSQIQHAVEKGEPRRGPVARIKKNAGYVTQTGQPGVVEVEGEIITVKQRGRSGYVSVGGDAGMVSQRVELEDGEADSSSFRWPEPSPGFTTDSLTLAEVVILDSALSVPQRQTAVILADERNVAQVGPGRYTRANFPELRKPLLQRAPVWKAILVDNRPFRMAFQAGPYRTVDGVPAGVRFIVAGQIPDDKPLSLWHSVIARTGSFTAADLAARLAPTVENVVETWLRERSREQLLPDYRDREALTLSLQVELRRQLEQFGFRLEEVTAMQISTHDDHEEPQR